MPPGPPSPAIDVALNTIGTSPAELATAAAVAEQAGFDGVWCYDHLSGSVLGGTRCVEVWSALTVVALATSSVAVGPLVLNASIRHPAHIAAAAASLDEVSQGRLRLGLGAGAGPESPYSRELAMLGLPLLDAATRRARVADVAGYLRALWSGAPSYQGTHYGFGAVGMPVEGMAVPQHDVALLVAANGPRMARLAGEVADALNVHDWQPDVEPCVDAALDAARAAGRRLDLTIEGPLTDEWLDRSSPVHGRLGELGGIGTARVMVRWDSSMGLDPLRLAARRLAPSTAG